MKIRRAVQVYDFKDIILEIELSDDELEEAFREKERQYRLEDAKNAVREAYEAEQISEEIYRKIENDSRFYETVREYYEDMESCNIPENVTWEEAWKKAIEHLWLFEKK
ncbi:MAG: hypothetical protein IJL07_09035 [Lachnospiraceae bacterium]|nr:hypothetical protein [Lachnospiraceae bacterium]